MSKHSKLMKSFEAFINHDLEAATNHYRQFFIESAQKINNQLEEDFGGDMEEDLYGEVQAEDEGEDASVDFSEFEDIDVEDEAADEAGDELQDEEGSEESDEEVPTAEEWEKFEDAFEELEALFNEVQSTEDEVQESFDYTKVPEVARTESGADVKSPVAGAAPDMNGASPAAGTSKDGHVTGSSTKAEAAPSYDVKDHNNVQKTGKKTFAKAKEPSAKEEGTQTVSPIKPLKK